MAEPQKKHILIVDDDRALSPLVAEYLQAKNFETTLCHNAEEGLKKFRSLDIDLCVLDIKMPIKNGFALAHEIREFSSDIPYLFLTSESAKEMRIEGLKMGADDYILKPFSMEELFLRIQLILKRSFFQNNQKKENRSHYKIGKLNFDSNTRQLSDGNEVINLSTIETQLLQMFCESNNGYVERENALKLIWNDDDMIRTRSLNVYVSKLRKHLESDPTISFLNVHGSGYKMVVKDN